MSSGWKTSVGLALASVLIAVALTFGAVELPRVVSAALLEQAEFPAFDHSYHREEYQSFLDAWHLRPIGYLTLSLVAVFIVAGFVLERRGLAATGAVAFFLPLFGHFARSMFFLAGLGLLRALWLPILDTSPEVLRLGDMVYLPYAALAWVGALLHADIRSWLSWLVMGGGMLLFVLGTLTWFRCRLAGEDLAQAGVYRLCRHPQYLGWLVWSYGFLIYLMRNFEGQHFKLRWTMPNSLPWVLTALVIVGMSWLEELALEKRHGDIYRRYRRSTAFLLPLPRWIRSVVSAPARLVCGPELPGSGRQVLAVIVLYLILVMALSLPFLVAEWPPRGGWWAFPYNVYPFG